MADKVSKPAAPLEVSIENEPSSPLRVQFQSMANKKQPPLLAVAVVLDVKLSPPSPAASMDKKKKKPLAVLLVCLWALTNTITFAGCAVVTLIKNRNPCTKSTWWFRCAELTRAAAAEATALWRGELWCGALQTAAAAVALVLAGRGGRRWSRWAWALAFVALAATAASHYMDGRVERIFLAAAPAGDAYITADVVMGFIAAMIDLIGFLCLLVLGDGGEE